MKFSEIVEKLGTDANNNSLEAYPDCNPEIAGLTSIEETTPGTISYIEGGKFTNYIDTTTATALVLPKDPKLQAKAIARGIAWISTGEPRLLYSRIIDLFYQPFHPQPEIHPTATIHPEAVIGKEVYIGPYTLIQQGVKIGDRACIHPNVVIYPDVTIGDRTILHANSTIHERAQIGNDCVIHSGAVIGSEGFGFVPTAKGWYKMQQSGNVVLEDGVEVGCNTTIDRPAVGETRIGRQTKIDNLVHIAHGCKIGSNCAIAGQVGLAGAVKVGNNVLLAGQVGIADHIKIGDGAIATAKAGIIQDVPPKTMVSGHPAIPHKLWLKVVILYNRLPELYQMVKQLQQHFGDK